MFVCGTKAKRNLWLHCSKLGVGTKLRISMYNRCYVFSFWGELDFIIPFHFFLFQIWTISSYISISEKSKVHEFYKHLFFLWIPFSAGIFFLSVCLRETSHLALGVAWGKAVLLKDDVRYQQDPVLCRWLVSLGGFICNPHSPVELLSIPPTWMARDIYLHYL